MQTEGKYLRRLAVEIAISAGTLKWDMEEAALFSIQTLSPDGLNKTMINKG